MIQNISAPNILASFTVGLLCLSVYSNTRAGYISF
jgi:hypothetical protein